MSLRATSPPTPPGSSAPPWPTTSSAGPPCSASSLPRTSSWWPARCALDSSPSRVVSSAALERTRYARRCTGHGRKSSTEHSPSSVLCHQCRSNATSAAGAPQTWNQALTTYEYHEPLDWHVPKATEEATLQSLDRSPCKSRQRCSVRWSIGASRFRLLPDSRP